MMIYKITNLINNKVYIGKTEKALEERWKRHLICVRNGTNRYLYDAIRHYGVENFIREEIDTAESLIDLNKKEKRWVKKLKSNNKKFGYNMTEGGTGGKLLPEIYEKIASKKRGIPLTEEHKQKCSKSLKGKFLGRKLTDIQKEKIRKTINKKLAEKSWTPNFSKIVGKKGKDHPMFGKRHSKEIKEKIGSHRKGKKLLDILGKEKYKTHIQWMKEKFSGEMNHNYKPIKKEEIEILIKNKLSEKEMINKLNISRWTFYSKLTKFWGHGKLSKIRKEYE